MVKYHWVDGKNRIFKDEMYRMIENKMNVQNKMNIYGIFMHSICIESIKRKINIHTFRTIK